MQIYRISFINQGQIYELYANTVRQAELYGFIEIEDLIFGETSGVVIDPSEEKLKNEFSGVNRTLVPMHAVIRVDEVTKKGPNKIRELDGNANITPFPGAIYPRNKDLDT